jgi:spore germination protein YaaH
MNRRANGRLPWGGGSGGIYGGGGGLGRLLMLGGVVLAVAVVGFLIASRACGKASCKNEYCQSARTIVAPDGYDLVSRVFEFNEDTGPIAPGTDVNIRIPLVQPTQDGANLGFYRYVEDQKAWEPIAAAVLDPQGRQVSGVLKDAPQILAVLRRLSEVGRVVAYLDTNARLHPDAAARVTIVHTLDFRPTSDGTLVGNLSAIKLNAGVQHIPVVSASAADKGNILVEAILSDSRSRSNHVQQILKKSSDTKAPGVDIAYLDLRADQRASFALFIAELSDQLRKQGKTLTLTLPAPVKVPPDRIDEGAYDWAELGKSADVLQIAPFRDQSTYRKDMPEVLQYLASLVPANKLVLTVTPYASEKAVEGIRRLSLAEAMGIATKLSIRGQGQRLETSTNVEIVGVNIDKTDNLTGVVWDPVTACVAFTYRSNGARTVWIENFFSVGFKLELIPRFGLGGVAIEDASDDINLGNIWTAVVPFVATGQPVLLQPNSTDLIPKWTATKGTIEGGPQGPKGSVTWVTPAEAGTYKVTLQLSDGVALFESELPANVQPRERTPAPSGTSQPGQTPTG